MPAVFTSITLAYLAKARVLARSVKRHSSSTTIYLVLAEPAPTFLREGIASGTEPFDVLLTDEDLGIEDHRRWMFQHSIVEACTALKGAALLHLIERCGEERILYLDPDVLVVSSLDGLFETLDRHSIALTPHCPDAESELDPIIMNEISSLAHGVYNLGFLGVSADAEGRRFAQWWWHRLYHFCQDNIPRGLFTDQRWIDLVPAQFERVNILRGPQYNAASWNITQRSITGTAPDELQVNGRPLCFFHFSGANSGIPERMVKLFGVGGSAVMDLMAYYREVCGAEGEADFGGSPWHYDTYSDGTPISRAQRVFFREEREIQDRFPDPFLAGEGGYLRWIESGPGSGAIEATYAETPEALRAAAIRLRSIEGKRAFRIYNRARDLGRLIRRGRSA